MMPLRRLLREAARCVLAGPSLASMGRRLAFAPLRLWLTNPRRALLFVAVRPYTMLPYKRLSKLAELADECNQKRIPGAFVQCGVWKGGSAAVLAALAGDRQVELFDTFDGCPEPSPKDISVHGRLGQAGEAKAGIHFVLDLLHRLGLTSPKIRVHLGHIESTVPLWVGEIGPIALLHLDCDWYQSTKVCMSKLYPETAVGGYVFADDAGYWPASREAIDAFFLMRGLDAPLLTWVDHTGTFWKKT